MFSDIIEKELFNDVYKYLCKVVYPCSLNEYITYLESYSKYNIYLVSSLKYAMVIIQYIYLDFIYKKCKEENKLNIDLLDICSYISLGNLYLFNTQMNSKKNKRIMKFFCYDLNNKYIEEKKNNFMNIQKEINNTTFFNNINRMLKEFREDIEESSYLDSFKEMFVKKK